MCRFLDRDGSMLALRADMTIPVARLVATRLHDCALPQRFCYAGSVFRDVEPRAGQQREFWQAGVELIGSAAPDADAEVLALTARALVEAASTNFASWSARCNTSMGCSRRCSWRRRSAPGSRQQWIATVRPSLTPSCAMCPATAPAPRPG